MTFSLHLIILKIENVLDRNMIIWHLSLLNLYSP